MEKKKRNYWNYETCKLAAEQCSKRGEFWEKYPTAAILSSKNKWLDDFFKPNAKKPSGFWTFENCVLESKKYKYYTEFRDKSFTVYEKCKKNGWINSFNWLINNLKKYDLDAKIHIVYSYEFTDLKCVYVGRTIQISQRDYTHKNPKSGKKDSVKEFCSINNINFPKPKVLEQKLTLVESKIREEYWCKYYVEKGFTLINKAKTGEKYSSIGGLAIKWDKESCYKEAKKYKTKIDFYKKSNGAWIAARKHDWLKDYEWLESPKKNKWDYSNCFECAKKTKSIIEFRKMYPQAYRKAANKKWIKDYTWLKRERHLNWSEEEIKKLISKYKTKSEFKNNEKKAWCIMANHKWYHLWEYLRKND